ncbi:MAG: WG repeat-containing protein [Candidatus Woesearchaeota archaeon]
MSNSQCEQIKAKYENLKTLKHEFDLEYKNALETGKLENLEKLKELQALLEKNRDALWEEIDPYQINLRQKLALTLSADYIGAFSKPEGVARVKKDNKWFYIDKTGREIITEKFDEAYPFSEGVAKVKKDKQLFYINKKGKRIFG